MVGSFRTGSRNRFLHSCASRILPELRIVASLSGASRRNPFGKRILTQFSSQPGSPWLGLGWRQFMYWVLGLRESI